MAGVPLRTGSRDDELGKSWRTRCVDGALGRGTKARSTCHQERAFILAEFRVIPGGVGYRVALIDEVDSTWRRPDGRRSSTPTATAARREAMRPPDLMEWGWTECDGEMRRGLRVLGIWLASAALAAKKARDATRGVRDAQQACERDDAHGVGWALVSS